MTFRRPPGSSALNRSEKASWLAMPCFNSMNLLRNGSFIRPKTSISTPPPPTLAPGQPRQKSDHRHLVKVMACCVATHGVFNPLKNNGNLLHLESPTLGLGRSVNPPMHQGNRKIQKRLPCNHQLLTFSGRFAQSPIRESLLDLLPVKNLTKRRRSFRQPVFGSGYAGLGYRQPDDRSVS